MSDTLAILNRNHVMIDIETLSQHQNAVILSIGACKFTFENGVTDKLYVNVDPKSCVKLGLHVSKETVQWWKDKPKNVRDALNSDQHDVKDALIKLHKFVGVDKNQLLWAQGSVFDFGILASARVATGIDRSWQYWQEMDSRTIFTMLGVSNRDIRKGDVDYHNALSDSISQAETLIGLFK